MHIDYYVVFIKRVLIILNCKLFYLWLILLILYYFLLYLLTTLFIIYNSLVYNLDSNIIFIFYSIEVAGVSARDILHDKHMMLV